MHPLKFIRIFYNNTWDETQNLRKFPQEFQKSHYGYIKGMQICEGYIFQAGTFQDQKQNVLWSHQKKNGYSPAGTWNLQDLM